MYKYALTLLFEQKMQHNDFVSATSKIRKIIHRAIGSDDFSIELTECYGSGRKCKNPDYAADRKAHFHGTLETTFKLTKELQNEIINAICKVISISLRSIKRIYKFDGWLNYINSHAKIGKVFGWYKMQKETAKTKNEPEIARDITTHDAGKHDAISHISTFNNDAIVAKANSDTCTDNSVQINDYDNIQPQKPLSLIGTIKTFIAKLHHCFSWLRVWV